MKRLYFLTAAIALSMLMAGCTRALVFNNGLFAHITEPLTFNKEPTEIRKCELDVRGRINQFQEPFVAAVSVRLGNNGLADVAKEHGINTIYYADIEHWSALFGLWSSDIVHIYGR